MDNYSCLKKITEDIVKKQNDSLESINKLYRETVTVSSDISNLMNSLQMVGNRQFAENRVQNDDLISGQLLQQKNISITTACDPIVPVSRDLRLSSILLKAIEFVPLNGNNNDDDDDTPPPPQPPCKPQFDDEDREDKAQSEQTPSKKTSSLEVAQSIPSHPCPPPPPPPPPPPQPLWPQHQLPSLPKPILTKMGPTQVNESLPPEKIKPARTQSEQNFVQSTRKDQSLSDRPIDRDRITDILKRYSLYDDVDDESE